MATVLTPTEPEQPTARITLREFLEKTPPGKEAFVTGITETLHTAHGTKYPFKLPEIYLHCGSEQCQGSRIFKAEGEIYLTVKGPKREFVNYVCKNCRDNLKSYALHIEVDPDLTNGMLFKFGESPAFGPPTPARLMKIVGPEREYYLKGRRAENQGMGIAAFAYYRRVVENMKDRILDEVIRVSQRLSAPQDMLNDLARAKAETRFSEAMGAIKHGLPQALLVNGHNPLSLLHSALSEGLHAETDEECLQLATSIRVVMSEFTERMAEALKDEAELNSAINRLLEKKANQKV